MGSDAFPAGLRVLVVDHDSACLNILHKMLINCNYQVTACSLAQEALDMLETRGGFDIVMSDLNVPDMADLKFLEQVSLKLDLPVIIMSVDGETSRAMKAVQHGACHYLIKPIRMKELRNIWQHAFRRRMHRVEAKESLGETLKSDDSSTFSGGDGDMAITCKKRKDFDQKNPSSVKKARVVWTHELHTKFVKAVNCIGLDNAGPKKILDMMGVPWLSRENVASHLQKYRLNLSRSQKGNDMKQEEGLNSVTLQQNIVMNENYASAAAGHVGGRILSMPLQAEGEESVLRDSTYPEMNSSRIGMGQPVELFKSESKIQAHCTPGHQFDDFALVPHNQGLFIREVYQDHNQAMVTNTDHFQNDNYVIGIDHHQTLLSFPKQGYFVGTGTSLRLPDVELNSHAYTNDIYVQNIQHLNLESFDGSNQEEKFVATADARLELYEAYNFEHEMNNGVGDQDFYIG